MVADLKLRQRSDAELKKNLHQTLAQRPDECGSDVGLFVYGLLVYDPPFKFTQCKPFTLAGWQRGFHLADPMNRGTPAEPGLTLGLERGGACDGVLFRLAGATLDQELLKVWDQEMRLPFYTPSWLTQKDTTLLTMATDAASPALRPGLSQVQMATVLAHARGSAGSNFEYLNQVMQGLQKHGQSDPYLTGLHLLAQAADVMPLEA